MLKSTLDIGFPFVVFWTGLREANLGKDRLHAPGHIDMAAATLFTAIQPIIERFTEAFFARCTGVLVVAEPLPRNKTLIQDLTQAPIEGSIIGAISASVTSLNKNNQNIMGWELAGVAPGLILFTALKIVMDNFLFDQKYRRIYTNGSWYGEARKALNQCARDLVDFRHCMTNRLPKLVSLAIFPTFYYVLVEIWEKAYGKGNLPHFMLMIAYSYYFLSYNILRNLLEVAHEITATPIQHLANRLRLVADLAFFQVGSRVN